MTELHLANVRTALYRLYDADDRLLYIGITVKPEDRWAAHAATKKWWPDVARKEIEWHDTRPIAEKAEVAAIKAELPLHNVDDSPIAPKPRALGPDEMTTASLAANLGAVIRRAAAGELIWAVDRTRQRKRQAAIASVEFGEAVDRVGGPDKAAEILRSYLEDDSDQAAAAPE